MKSSIKKPVSLPKVRDSLTTYTLNSIEIAKKGCYSKNNTLLIDQNFGDYNMNLFRLRNKR